MVAATTSAQLDWLVDVIWTSAQVAAALVVPVSGCCHPYWRECNPVRPSPARRPIVRPVRETTLEHTLTVGGAPRAAFADPGRSSC